jgi:hypothetical protein
MVIDHQYACGIRRRLWCRVRDLGVGRGGEGVTSTADWPPFPAVVGQRLASTPPAYPSPWPAASHIHAIIALWGLHTWIGPRWLVGAEGPSPYVRMEIELALRYQVKIIPVLVHGARMPAAQTLAPRACLRRGYTSLSASLRSMIRIIIA